MKKTPTQEEFDLAKHGWAFCNAGMLLGRLARLTEIARRLERNDPRQIELQKIREAFHKMDI